MIRNIIIIKNKAKSKAKTKLCFAVSPALPGPVLGLRGVCFSREIGSPRLEWEVLRVKLLAENASTGFLEGVICRRRRPQTGNPRLGWYGWGSSPPPERIRMSEDERLELVRTAAEAHSGLSEIAFKLRRELPAKAPALKEALKAERVAFRLKRELQKLDLTDPDPPERRGPSGEFRRGGKVIDVERLRR